MRTAAPFALAATLGWGIAMTAPVVGAADQIHKSQQNVDKAELQLPSGFKAKDLGQAQNIRGELATVTQDAVTRDDFGTASLIEEGNGTWRFAIPTGSSPQQIHRQLQDQLTYFGRDMKQWPANESDAYRMLSHHVIMPLYDVNAPERKAK